MKGQSGSFSFLLLSWNLKAWIRWCMRKAIYFYWVNCKHLVLKTFWAFMFSGLQHPLVTGLPVTLVLVASDEKNLWLSHEGLWASLEIPEPSGLLSILPSRPLPMNWFGGKMWGFTRIYNHCWIELLHSQNSIHFTFINVIWIHRILVVWSYLVSGRISSAASVMTDRNHA